MMKHKKMILTFMIILLIFCIGITYSIFNSSATLASENQNVAKFIFNAEVSDQLNLSLLDVHPGDEKDYNFSVTNNDIKDTSEVTIEYELIIKTYHFIPFIIELYKIGEENEEFVFECDEITYTRNDQNELVCNSPVQEMKYDAKMQDDYKLKVEFPSKYNDVSYADLVDYITIEIKSWQKISS